MSARLPYDRATPTYREWLATAVVLLAVIAFLIWRLEVLTPPPADPCIGFVDDTSDYLTCKRFAER